MDAYIDISKLLIEFAETFPKESALLAREMERLTGGSQDYYTWLELMAELTRGYFIKKDSTKASAILLFLSKQMEKSDALLRAAICTVYLNQLDIGLSDDHKQWAAALLPDNLRSINPAVFS